MELDLSYHKLKLIGIFMLPLFHGMALLGAFQFSIFKYLNPYYGPLYPLVLIISTVFFVLGVFKENKGDEQGWSSDKILTFVGGFFILMNFLVSLVVYATKT